jgi:hypothetical protein
LISLATLSYFPFCSANLTLYSLSLSSTFLQSASFTQISASIFLSCSSNALLLSAIALSNDSFLAVNTLISLDNSEIEI